MSHSAFTHILSLDQISDKIQEVELSANSVQCAALALELDLPSVESLRATLAVHAIENGVAIKGNFAAVFHYACRVTRDPFPASLAEPINVVFTTNDLPDPTSEEYVLSTVEMLPLEDQSVDLGRLVAESLTLALDPFPRGPGADDALAALGILTEEQARAESSPFAALQGQVGKTLANDLD
jgi:uncharacterized metal-binding protein YceD (DUF177 family)